MKKAVLGFYISIICLCGWGCAPKINHVNLSLDEGKDFTPQIIEILEANPQGELSLHFEKGIYDFYPEKAFSKWLAVSNNDNGQKRIVFKLENMKRIKIVGQQTEFRFHGELIPFYINRCEEVEIEGITFDYDYPFVLEGQVIASSAQKKSIDLKITSGNPIRVQNDTLYFSGYDWEATLGESILFDSRTRSPYYRTMRFYHPIWKQQLKAELLSKDVVRLSGYLSEELPPIGSIYVDKGPYTKNRRVPSIVVHRAKNLRLQNVTIHASGAMALIAENSENIDMQNFNVRLRENSPRVISSSADATHFVNCRGLIRFENCLFENMLDDAANVHGVYLPVDEIIGGQEIHLHYGHFQQEGFEFAEKGDTLQLIDRTSLKPVGQFIVGDITIKGEKEVIILATEKLQGDFPQKLAVENPQNMPRVEMRHCTVRQNRARSILLSTPKRIIIEDNYFSSMMAGILIAGDANSWFESSNTQDVIIRGNEFVNIGFGAKNPQSVLQISPEIPMQGRSQDFFYHGKILFENNTIRTFDAQVVYALSVKDLQIKNNRFVQSHDYKPVFKELCFMDLQNCHSVFIQGNTYQGEKKVKVSAIRCKNVTLGKGQKGFEDEVVEAPNTFFYQQ